MRRFRQPLFILGALFIVSVQGLLASAPQSVLDNPGMSPSNSQEIQDLQKQVLIKQLHFYHNQNNDSVGTHIKDRTQQFYDARVEEEKKNLALQYREALIAEKLRLRLEERRRQHAELKVLLAYLREQLAPYGLHLAFGGETGTQMVVSPFPNDSKQLFMQARKFANEALKNREKFIEAQRRLMVVQDEYARATPENKESVLESLWEAQKNRDSAALALETAEIGLAALEKLQVKHSNVAPAKK